MSIIAFIVLTVGIVSMARVVSVYEAVSAAAREGTRYAIAHGPNSTSPASVSDVQSVVNGQLSSNGLDPTSTTINVTWPADPNPQVANGTDILVQVSYPFTPPFFSSIHITLSGSSRMLIWNW